MKNIITLTSLLLACSFELAQNYKECHNQTDCDQTSICNYFNDCECAANYIWDFSTEQCENIVCNMTNDGHVLDEDSYPDHMTKEEIKEFVRYAKECGGHYDCDLKTGICHCEEGYVPDPRRNNYCLSISWTFGKYCNYTEDYLHSCTTYDMPSAERLEVCIDYKCQCRPGLRYDETSGNCRPFKCGTDKECQTYDKHRVCDDGQCQCEDGFIPNSNQYPYNQLCIARNVSYGKTCQKDKDCFQDKQRCVDHQCICIADAYYLFRPNGREAIDDCVWMDNCSKQVDKSLGITCDQGIDKDRVCVEDKCVCRQGFGEDRSNGGKCVPNSVPIVCFDLYSYIVLFMIYSFLQNNNL